MTIGSWQPSARFPRETNLDMTIDSLTNFYASCYFRY